MTNDSLAVLPSKGKERMKRLQRASWFRGSKMAADGSRWQFLGRSPIRLAPRDAIDNEFFRMADEASSVFTTFWSTMVLGRRGRPIPGAPSRMNRALRSAFPMSHKR
jgi:hypothetical protein